MRSHFFVRRRMFGSCSAIHNRRSAVLNAQRLFPPIENVFSIPIVFSHHCRWGSVLGQSQLMNGYSHVPFSSTGTPSMPIPVTATAAISPGSSRRETASRTAAAAPPQIWAGSHTVHSGCAASGWKRSVGRDPLETTVPDRS